MHATAAEADLVMEWRGGDRRRAGDRQLRGFT